MTNPRTSRVQGLRRSNAATPHGTGRRPALDVFRDIEERRQALVESLAAEMKSREESLAAEAAGNEHAARYEADYGIRFICACGAVSSFYTSREKAEDAHAEHAGEGTGVGSGGWLPLA